MIPWFSISMFLATIIGHHLTQWHTLRVLLLAGALAVAIDVLRLLGARR